MRRDRTPRRRGFTLIELLVVITIIAILIALLLPAVQAIREAAALLQCQNNIKQLSLACHNYHTAHKRFPPAIQFDSGENATTSDKFRPNWLIIILPYIEQQPLYDQFDFTKTIKDNRNKTARGQVIASLLCPSDIGGDQKMTLDGGNWARGNYAANVGHDRLNNYDPRRSNNNWSNPKKKGVMGWNRSAKLPLQDGASNTILLGEIRIGLEPIDRRGAWAMGTAGASALVWCGYGGDANGPNPCNDNSDDIENGNQLNYANLKKECMTVWRPCPSYQAAPRSRHASGGVVVAFADGSVHFISNYIDVGSGPWSGCCSVWDRLILSNDGLPVDSSSLGF